MRDYNVCQSQEVNIDKVSHQVAPYVEPYSIMAVPIGYILCSLSVRLKLSLRHELEA